MGTCLGGSAALWRDSPSQEKLEKTAGEGHWGMASERVLFWQKKLAENQQILAQLDAGQFQRSHGEVLDEQTTAEMRAWAARRVAEYAIRIAEWSCRWA
jgi:hypothetical protein